MTVGELINKLRRFDDEMEVEFAYDYGDYTHSTVASPISSIEKESVRYSEYHQMDEIVYNDEYDDEYDDESSSNKVVILY